MHQFYSREHSKLIAQQNGRSADMQSVFDTYNEQYFRGRLPRYKVLISDKYNFSRCLQRNFNRQEIIPCRRQRGP
jgi:hypothetical protein